MSRNIDFIREAIENPEHPYYSYIAPDDTCGVDTLTKDKEARKRLYKKGYFDGAQILGVLRKDILVSKA